MRRPARPATSTPPPPPPPATDVPGPFGQKGSRRPRRQGHRRHQTPRGLAEAGVDGGADRPPARAGASASDRQPRTLSRGPRRCGQTAHPLAAGSDGGSGQSRPIPGTLVGLFTGVNGYSERLNCPGNQSYHQRSSGSQATGGAAVGPHALGAAAATSDRGRPSSSSETEWPQMAMTPCDLSAFRVPRIRLARSQNEVEEH